MRSCAFADGVASLQGSILVALGGCAFLVRSLTRVNGVKTNKWVACEQAAIVFGGVGFRNGKQSNSRT